MDPPPKVLMLRRLVIGAAIGVTVFVTSTLYWKSDAFPPDTTPEGAYMRVAVSVNDDKLRSSFAYLEDQAQHAAHSIHEYRKKASERVDKSYPEPERSRLLEAYKAHASAEDGADVWVDMAKKRGWATRLRHDLSGIDKVEIIGERATVQTARGTRYGFRRRPNGIWGLTLFTADLVAEAERAARDAEVVEKAASDYERGR